MRARTKVVDLEARRLRTRITRLEDERRRLLQAHLAGAIPVELLREQQERITRELANAGGALAGTELHWETIEANLKQALELLSNPQQAYGQSSAAVRRGFNQALFEWIRVDADGVTYARSREPFALLLSKPSELNKVIKNPGRHSRDRGSNKDRLVEVPGVEPGSSVTSAGLLRAQPVRKSRDAATHRQLRRPQPRCDVPPGHEARPGGKPLKMTPLSGRVAEPDGTRGR